MSSMFATAIINQPTAKACRPVVVVGTKRTGRHEDPTRPEATT